MDCGPRHGLSEVRRPCARFAVKGAREDLCDSYQCGTKEVGLTGLGTVNRGAIVSLEPSL